MNDDELIGPADEPDAPDGDVLFADLGHFQTGVIPVDAVLRQGKAIRKRRRVLGGGILAAAAVLTIAVPVALAGGSGEDLSAASGPRIVVNRPDLKAADRILLSGTFYGKRWSLTVRPGCDFGSDGECSSMVSSSDPVSTPVDLLVDDVKDPGMDNYFYVLRYSPETDFTVVTLSTGDQVTVPGVDVDSTHRTAWFPAPRSTPITKIVAYRKDGTQIGHTPDWGKDISDGDVLGTWYRPDGTTLHSVPNVVVARGTTGGVDWDIESTIGPSGLCFVYRIGSVPRTVYPAFGVKTYMNNVGKPGPKDGVVVGEVAPETTRVDVTFKDGTVQHLTPVRNDHVFVGTYVPDGATVVSVRPVTGTNG